MRWKGVFTGLRRDTEMLIAVSCLFHSSWSAPQTDFLETSVFVTLITHLEVPGRPPIADHKNPNSAQILGCLGTVIGPSTHHSPPAPWRELHVAKLSPPRFLNPPFPFLFPALTWAFPISSSSAWMSSKNTHWTSCLKVWLSLGPKSAKVAHSLHPKWQNVNLYLFFVLCRSHQRTPAVAVY